VLAVDLAFVVALVGLYLVDCVVLVQRGQAVLERPGRRWRLATGTRHYLIRGCPVVVLNPFAPWATALKSRPLFEPPSPEALRPSAVVRALRASAALAALQWTLVLVLLPLALVRHPGWPLLVLLVAAYGNAVAMAWMLFRSYRRLGVARGRLWPLAFNALVCLPLSINVPRRAGLAVPIADGADRWLRLLPGAARPGARSALRGQLEEALQDADEGSPRSAALTVLLRTLAR
jgi:hypothetical protein